MHPSRSPAVPDPAEPEQAAADRFAWARDFVIGWLAGLIFFGTMLS